MKAKINYKSRKTIIIAAIALIVLIAAIIGTVAFIKGNKTAAAAMPGENNASSETTIENQDNESSNQNEGDVVAPTINNEGDNAQNVDNNQEEAGTTSTTTNGTTSSTTGTTTGTTAGTTGTTTGDANVPNEEYTQTTTIVTEKPWETKTIGWSPLSISAYTATANLGINKPNLSSEKLAYVQGDSLEVAPKNTAIQKGEIITYVIKVTNNGNLNALNIRTIDTIPDGTEVVKVENDGTIKNGKITWKTDIKAGETIELKFQVKVVADSINLIENTAKVNGKDTNKTQNPVITSNKKAEIVVIKGNELAFEQRDAMAGETIIYTITAKNTSNVAGTTTITDEIPAGTTLVANSITGDGELSNGTITWSDVEVPANSETSVSFKVTINADRTTSVENTAIVGGTPTETIETKVANITGEKSVNKTEAKVGEELEYTITLTNSGNAAGKTTITDQIPAGTTIKDATTNGYDATTNTMTWSNVEVKPGEPVELKLVVNVVGGVETIKNTAYIDTNNKIPQEPTTEVKYYYTIEHYQEQVDGSFEMVESKNSSYVSVGTETSYTAKDYSTQGYYFDDSKTVNKNAVVPTNNDLVIKLYYTRRTDLGYTVNYYYNGEWKYNKEYTKQEYLDEITSYDEYATYEGVTYTKYNVETSNEDKSLPLIIGLGTNYINVYYGSPNLTISKYVNKSTANTGDTLHYTIEVSETRKLVDATNVIVEDTLPTGLSNITNITNGGNFSNGKITWNIAKIGKGEKITLEFDAKVTNAIGTTITNNVTAKISNTTIEASVTTSINPKSVEVRGLTKGKEAEDVNIIFIMDNSSSMNEPIASESYSNNSLYVAPSDVEKTRLYSAKTATAQFIQTIYNDDNLKNTNMSVITFNKNDANQNDTGYTIVSGPYEENDSQVKKEWVQGFFGGYYKYYIEKDNKKIELTKATDNKYYEIVSTTIATGTQVIGSATSDDYTDLIDDVNNISIGCRREGFGTYIDPALKKAKDLIDDYKKAEASKNNRNIVIILCDGDISDDNKYATNLTNLKEAADDIYCIGFGSDFSDDKIKDNDGNFKSWGNLPSAYRKLANITTIYEKDANGNNTTTKKVYTAGDTSTLITEFTSILEGLKATNTYTTGTSTITGVTVKSGEIAFPLTYGIQIGNETPITIYSNETSKITCTSQSDFAKYGITYDTTKNIIKWDINECLRQNPTIDLSGELKLTYYVS